MRIVQMSRIKSASRTIQRRPYMCDRGAQLKLLCVRLPLYCICTLWWCSLCAPPMLGYLVCEAPDYAWPERHDTYAMYYVYAASSTLDMSNGMIWRLDRTAMYITADYWQYFRCAVPYSMCHPKWSRQQYLSNRWTKLHCAVIYTCASIARVDLSVSRNARLNGNQLGCDGVLYRDAHEAICAPNC